MTYYTHVAADGKGLGVWEITEAEVRRADGALVKYPRPIDLDVIKNIESTAAFSTVYELALAPGQFYPRMARPSSAHPSESPGYCPDNIKNRNVVHETLGQLAALKEQLERICRVVHPTPENFAAFGHETRNLLILASTEVETQWKGILRAHGAKSENTKSYVKLAPALRLSEYRIALPFYPTLQPFRPFENWNLASTTPTKDLHWYDAYNAVKHDRENENALQAVAAYVVMICSQFGWHFSMSERYDLRSYFNLAAAPAWEPSDGYTPLLHEGDLKFPTPIVFPF